VKIDLHKLLLYNRRDSVNQNLNKKTEAFMMYVWKKAMLNRKMMNKGGSKIKNFVLKNFYKSQWGNRRELPHLAEKSFNEIWRDKHSQN
jgi:L-lactate dehydrogenase complex protein LldF